MEERPMHSTSMLFCVVLLFVLIIAVGVVFGVALNEQTQSYPQDIDIVVIENNSGSLNAQVTAIANNLAFRRNIFIMTSEAGRVNGPANIPNVENAFYFVFAPSGITQKEKIKSYFSGVSNIPEIASHFLFLGDYSVPFRIMSKNSFFYGTRPRAFNVFRDASELVYLEPFFSFTAPAIVGQTAFVNNGQTDPMQTFVLLELSQDRAVLRNDFNRDIFVYTSDPIYVTNYNMQFSEITSNPPLFATFHVTGSDLNSGYDAVATFLNQQFIVG